MWFILEKSLKISLNQICWQFGPFNLFLLHWNERLAKHYYLKQS